MGYEQYYPDDGPWAVTARLSFLAAVAALLFASFAPASVIPRIIYSFHLEHFAAFYIVALATAAAFARRDILHLCIMLWAFALTVELLRLLQPDHRPTAVLDWFADAAGALAALTPIALARFRDRFRPLAPRAPAR